MMLLPSYGLTRNLMLQPPQPDQQDRFGGGITPTNLPTDSLTDQPKQSPYDDFVNRWKTIASNRPQRDAYMKMVGQGEPDVKPTKMNRLHALLSGIGSSLTEGPSAASALQTNILDSNQNKALGTYDRQSRRLGAAAGMESEDVNTQLRGLENETQNYFRNNEDQRQGAELKIKQGEAVDRSRLTDAQIKNMEDEMTSRGFEFYDNQATGHRMAWNKKTNEVKDLGINDLTPQAKSDMVEKREKNVEGTRTAGRLQEIAEQGKNQLANTEARNKANAATLSQKLAAHGSTLKPGDKYKQVILDVTNAINSDPSLASAGKYLVKNAVGGIDVAPDTGSFFSGDDEETTAAKDKLRKIIADSLKKQESIQAPTIPTNNTGGNTGVTSSGSRYSIKPLTEGIIK